MLGSFGGLHGIPWRSLGGYGAYVGSNLGPCWVIWWAMWGSMEVSRMNKFNLNRKLFGLRFFMGPSFTFHMCWAYVGPCWALGGHVEPMLPIFHLGSPRKTDPTKCQVSFGKLRKTLYIGGLGGVRLTRFEGVKQSGKLPAYVGLVLGQERGVLLGLESRPKRTPRFGPCQGHVGPMLGLCWALVRLNSGVI